MKTWEHVFGDHQNGIPKEWSHFTIRLETEGKILSLEKLIEALEKGKFFKTLKKLYSEIVEKCDV